MITVKTLQNKLRATLGYNVSSQVIQTYLGDLDIVASSLSSVISEDDCNRAHNYIVQKIPEVPEKATAIQPTEGNMTQENTENKIVLSEQQKHNELKKIANNMQIQMLEEDIKAVAQDTNNVFLSRQQMLKELSTQLRRYVQYMVEQDNKIIQDTTSDLSQDMSASNKAVVNLVEAFKQEVGSSNEDLKRAVSAFSSILAVPEI